MSMPQATLVTHINGHNHGRNGARVCSKHRVIRSHNIPATADNSQAQCITCSLCDGAKTDIFVEAHGSGSKYVTN